MTYQAHDLWIEAAHWQERIYEDRLIKDLEFTASIQKDIFVTGADFDAHTWEGIKHGILLPITLRLEGKSRIHGHSHEHGAYDVMGGLVLSEGPLSPQVLRLIDEYSMRAWVLNKLNEMEIKNGSSNNHDN